MADHSFALLFGEKGKIFCDKFFSFYDRFPQLLKKTALRELGCYLSHCSELFLESRSTFLLARIFLAFHRMTQGGDDAEVQRISLKIIQINSSVCGIAVSLYSLHESERFNDKHILKAIQKLIPGIIPIPSSFFSYQYKSISLYYLEIKKIRGNGFSINEKQKLRTELLNEFKKSIESISLALFLPGNEEELFKNIRHLSQEIKYLHDLPQVMITFVEYLQDTLKFLVIVLRAIKPSTPSLVTLSSQLPSLVQFSLEKVFCVGRLRKKYPKEASIFTLEVKSSLFSRNNQAVNLRSARLYIVKAIESMLGPFRDYNGGLLNKENEQLLAIKRVLEAKNLSYPFLEDLFYSIKPTDMRALLTVETGVEMASCVQEMFERHLEGNEKYARLFCQSQDLRLAIIKTKEKYWKASLSACMLAHCSQFGCSTLEREGYLYLCFFHQYANSDVLFETLHKELAQHTKLSSYSRRILLNINFQSGDPLSLNPRLAADMPCHILSNLLFEGLTSVDRTGDAKPAIAERIEISACGTIYTFHLRQAWWSNGEEVTAYHFEKTWKKALKVPFTGCPYPDFFFLIKNVEKARADSVSLDEVGIEVKDAKTLLVTLEAPCPYFLDLLSTPPFFPLLGDGEEPSDFNGPFTVAEWKRNSWLHLSQNPFYRNAQQIKLGGIKISMVRDPYAAFEMFQKGELDFIGDPISPLPPDILKRPHIQYSLIHKQISRIFWIHCNPKVFPLNHSTIRRALSLALNRKQITEKVLIHQIPQLSPLPSKYALFRGNEEGDPFQAKWLFEKALSELKVEKQNFPTLVITHSDLSFEKPLFEELKSQWKEILGIDVVSQHLRWNEFSAALEKGNFQLCGLFRRDFFNNALFYLNFFKSSPTNPHSLDNEEYASLLHYFNRGEKNEEALKKIENLLIKETPVIPLVNQKFLALISERINGIDWDENGCLYLKDVWINEKND